jgi:glucose-1-phosphate cytidylyltransferase
MKVVILAGGFGTRISEESHLVPKPMIKIGGKPILWHIMQYYASFGHKEFIILGGYKQELIKDYFNNYYINNSDLRFNLKDQTKELVKSYSDDWVVTVLDTGLNTMTAGRILYAKKELANDDSFLLTYGDGLSNVDLSKLIDSHKKSHSVVTITAVRPNGRFGLLDIDVDNKITSFKEKAVSESSWVNGGFMIADTKILDFINGPEDILEVNVLKVLAEKNLLGAYKHYGFWHSMDTLRDKEHFESLVLQGNTPWIKQRILTNVKKRKTKDL